MVLPDRVGLFGHSRGNAATLSYIMGASDASVRAAVLESGGYPKEWADRAGQVRASILILHGAGDTSVGGAPVLTPSMARDFETALKRAGKAPSRRSTTSKADTTPFLRLATSMSGRMLRTSLDA